MKRSDKTVKHARWLPYLLGCIALGCASGPQTQNAAWPWQYGKEYGNNQTGGYIAISGPVASFGEPPPAAQPVKPDSLPKPVSAARPSADAATAQAAPPVPPAERDPGASPRVPAATGTYDFAVRDVAIAPPSYLPQESAQTVYDVMAFNHGNAPVSVSLGVDPEETRNLSADKSLPHNTVIPPHTEQAMARFAPRQKNESFAFRYNYAWTIGDFRAVHNCPEQYRYPFANGIQAYARVNARDGSTAYTRHAVIFTMPAGTPVLAARKGTVIQIKTDARVDILHDDETIATYSQLGSIDGGLFAGKAVTTEDTLGTGAADKGKKARIQLTVWRPEARPVASAKAQSPNSGFELVSFPLEFCSSGSRSCGVLTRDQPVARGIPARPKKPGKRTAKQPQRPAGGA